MKLILLFVFAVPFPLSHAYMSHDEIVKQLHGEQAVKKSKRKSGKPVYYEPIDNVLKKKKKKPSKIHTQGFGKKKPTPTPTITPTPTVEPLPSAIPTTTPVPGAGVDRRNCDTSVKSQGSTPRCTAFGSIAALENLACDHIDLSPGHFWSMYGKAYSDTAMATLPGKYITLWSKWPGTASKGSSGYLDDAKTKALKTTYIDGKTLEDDLKAVRTALDSGKMVNVGFSVASDLASCFSVVRASSKVTSGGHHVSVSGYQNDSTLAAGIYLILKNSWGADCGDKGYQYFDPAFCAKNGAYCYFYIVEGFEKK